MLAFTVSLKSGPWKGVRCRIQARLVGAGFTSSCPGGPQGVPLQRREVFAEETRMHDLELQGEKR